jgi:hypothetical protein
MADLKTRLIQLLDLRVAPNSTDRRLDPGQAPPAARGKTGRSRTLAHVIAWQLNHWRASPLAPRGAGADFSDYEAINRAFIDNRIGLAQSLPRASGPGFCMTHRVTI